MSLKQLHIHWVCVEQSFQRFCILFPLFLHFCPFFQVLVLGHAFTLEQRLQLTEVHGSVSLHNLLIHNKGESLMLNLVLPLCLKIGCGNKDDPKLRNYDIKFTLNLLLNMINPGGNKNRSTNNGISASGSNIGRCNLVGRMIVSFWKVRNA